MTTASFRLPAAVSALLAVMACGGHPQAFEYQSSETEGVPTLTWSGDGMSVVEARPAHGDVEPTWRITCPDPMSLCIQSPVRMGVAPDDVEVDGTLGDLIEPGEYLWQLTGVSEAGTWVSAPVPFQVEEQIAVPTQDAEQEVGILKLLEDLLSVASAS